MGRQQGFCGWRGGVEARFFAALRMTRRGNEPRGRISWLTINTIRNNDKRGAREGVGDGNRSFWMAGGCEAEILRCAQNDEEGA